MEVILNGEPHSIEQPGCSIETLIKNLELEGKFAIEINQNIIPRSEYLKTEIHQGDNIEIVQAIGGG
jgi:sulfur carrier protein